MRRICKYCNAEYDGDPGGSCCPNCAEKIKSTSVRERACTICGVKFPGGPSALYCPDCRIEQKRQASREYKRRSAAGKARKIGSTDICRVCGKPYTVTGALQKYCPACSEEAIRANDRQKSLEWNREHTTPEERREERHEAAAPIRCVVCGKSFVPNSAAKTCSPACAEALRKESFSRWESENRQSRNAYKKERYQNRKEAMTEEEYLAYREKINAAARENYKKRKQKGQSS